MVPPDRTSQIRPQNTCECVCDEKSNGSLLVCMQLPCETVAATVSSFLSLSSLLPLFSLSSPSLLPCSKLSHPNLLQLLAVTLTSDPTSLILVSQSCNPSTVPIHVVFGGSIRWSLCLCHLHMWPCTTLSCAIVQANILCPPDRNHTAIRLQLQSLEMHY